MTRAVTIVGLGLIGGAVGMALRRKGWRVLYADPNVPLDDARRAGAADERVDSAGEDDLVVLATPVDQAVAFLREGDRKNVVTSVCSVMRPLREAAGGAFVAGHPMTGWHEGGLANAHHVSFADCSWFLDAGNPLADNPLADKPLIEALVRDCGATPILVDAARHDAAVALTSHLPQVLSTALFAYLQDEGADLSFAGSGLRSFRLAASDGTPWRSVLEANREALRPHADAVASLVRAIIEGDDDDAFARAQALWRKLQS